MGVPVKIGLDGLDTALLGLSHAQPELKKATAWISSSRRSLK